jgi:DNA primase catalytic core
MLFEQAMIQEVKARHELAAFIESKGVKLKRTGKVYQGLCPFHADHNPSLIVDPEKQLWSCLGACKGNGGGRKSSGDVLAFLMRLEKLTFKEALVALGGKVPEETPLDMKGKERVEILTRTVDVYHKALLESLEAQAYLKARGFTNADTWRAFKLGYAAGTLAAKAESRRLKAVGLLTATGRERFQGCITVPLHDGEAVVGLYGRKIKGAGHYYLPGPHRGLFNANHASKSKEIILTESILDALSFIEAGFLNVLPLYGINGLTADHLRFFEEYGTRQVTLCLDSDDAGRKACGSIAEKLKLHGIESRTITLPAKDPNELLVKEGPENFQKIAEGLLKEETPTANRVPPTASTPASEFHIFFDDSELKEDDPQVYERDGRKYMLQGLPHHFAARLFVNLCLIHKGKKYHDRLDLYSARARQGFINRVAPQVETEARLLEEDLIFLIEKLEKFRDKEMNGEAKPLPLQMTQAEKEEAYALLKSKDLFDTVAADMETLGYVGEDANKRLAYLVSVSRKLNEPLSMVILSQSGSGKSALAEVTETLTPPENVKMLSRITPQALYYLEPDELSHKLVIIEERSGSEQADYSIRTLQTKKKLTLAAPIKDQATGKIKTQTFEIFGPTAFIESTTEPSINYENATRCFEIYLDESPEQTLRIHEWQKFFKTEDGLLLKAGYPKIIQKHHNAQRLLKSLAVIIPYAKHIQFPNQKLRSRRDHQRFLNLIEVLAFLHQYQRKRQTIGGKEMIVAGIEDYSLALGLAHDLLHEIFRDCQKPLRDLLSAIQGMLKERAEKEKHPLDALSFTRKDVREYTGLPHQRIKRLFSELEEYEYIIVDKGQNGSRNLYRLTGGPLPATLGGFLTPAELKGKYAWTR